MTTNPYHDSATSFETIATERTLLVDPATGATITIGARVEHVTVDAVTGRQHREVTHLVACSADGQQLLFPYKQALFACACCGARPLMHATRCSACGRFVCDACRVLLPTGTICRDCDRKPWWLRVCQWITNL